MKTIKEILEPLVQCPKDIHSTQYLIVLNVFINSQALYKKVSLIFILILLNYGCHTKPNQDLENNIKWATYKSKSMGISFSYPKSHTTEINEKDKSVIFRHEGYPYLLLNRYTFDEAKDRGLWAKHSVIDTQIINNRTYDFYEYDHCDVFSCMRTLSYVTNNNENNIAIEFRTESNKNFDIHKHLIESIE